MQEPPEITRARADLEKEEAQNWRMEKLYAVLQCL